MVFCWMADRLQQFLAEKLYNETLSEWFTSPEVNCGRQWVVFTANYWGQANIMLNMTGRIISVDGIYSCLAIPLRGANKDPTTPLSQLASLLNFISIAQEYWTRKTQTLADVNFVALNRRKHTFFIAVCGCGEDHRKLKGMERRYAITMLYDCPWLSKIFWFCSWLLNGEIMIVVSLSIVFFITLFPSLYLFSCIDELSKLLYRLCAGLSLLSDLCPWLIQLSFPPFWQEKKENT